MKKNNLLILLAILITSCSTTREQRIDRRNQKKCELAAYKWGCNRETDTAYIEHTNMITIYRDTVISFYLPGEIKRDSVLVYVQKDPDSNIICVTSGKSILKTQLATSCAWIEAGKLRHKLEQHDSVMQLKIDNAIKINSYFASKSLTRTIIKQVNILTWCQQLFIWSGRLALIALALFIVFKVMKVYPLK
jgi:hypothetical protein